MILRALESSPLIGVYKESKWLSLRACLCNQRPFGQFH
jgi:hypothetical protein